MSAKRTEKSKADVTSREEEAGEIKTLGVLLVHGIGVQRRGETLSQCGGAIHSWLRDWIKHNPNFVSNPVNVEVVDSSLTTPEPGCPAHTRILFRQGGQISENSWLVAESCWAETFYPPSYREFAWWALSVVPFAVLMHLLPPFRRAWDLSEDLRNARRSGFLPLHPFTERIQRLGAAWQEDPLRDLSQRDGLTWLGFRVSGQLFRLGLLLVIATIAGFVTQLLLIAVMAIAWIPIGFLRTFAGKVQRTLSATMGDSYLFITSPITGSAIVSQVRRDLEWLAARCDRVVILAHSQGAAVTYRMIEELSWQGRVPEKLHWLITYGSGLRKLFDLKMASQNAVVWLFYGVTSLVISAGLVALGVLCVMGHVPVLAGVLAAPVGLLLLMGVLLAARDTAKDHPPLLPVTWEDLYASDDPVPNGPIEVSDPPNLPEGPLGTAVRMAAQVTKQAFYGRQREVVNEASTLSDHTTYWSSKDDFVGRVVSRLAEASKIPIHMTLDKDWMDLAVARRRWRVALLSGCRLAAGFSVLLMLFWPAGLLARVGQSIQPYLGQLKTAVFDEPVPARIQTIANAIPDWLIGSVALVAAVWIVLLLAELVWRTWELREFGHYFHRNPYVARSVGLVAFALGWVGVVLAVPVAAAVVTATPWETLLELWWALLLVAGISVCTAVMARKAPGTRRDLLFKALDRGERLLKEASAAGTSDERLRLLRSSQFCFEVSQRLLQRAPDTAASTRALRGLAEVAEQLKKDAPTARTESQAA